MLFMLPIKMSISPRRTPYVNYWLIGVNVFIFLVTYTWSSDAGQSPVRAWAMQFELTPARPYIWQFVTYAFLHGGFGHIIGNMFFLYLFGNNVNDKLGSLGYLCLYLAGAIFSGLGHAALHQTPVLGASGAVAAVTGAYLVLFPQSMVTVFFWVFYFIDTFQVSALYLIGFKLIFWDNVIAPKFSGGGIAYDAHLAGYAFGAIALLIMLGTGVISRSGVDLLSMIKHWDRRRRYRDVVAGGYDPFSGRMKSKSAKAKEVKKTPAQIEAEEQIRELRSQISELVAQRNLPQAANVYLELIKIDQDQIIPRQQLLDIANQLASGNNPEASAIAYEKFLAAYSSYEYTEQVELMLGILYSRYLNEPDHAKEHLKAAEKKLTDPGQLSMCRQEIDKLGD
jgi:membrane associated rhomboid family serine protease